VSGPATEGHPHWDRDEVHDVYRRWRRVSDTYPGDRTFVAEVWVQSVERLALYLRPDELHTTFNFGFLLAPWDADSLRAAIDESRRALAGVGAPATWVLSNHDVVRHVTRYGGGELGVRRARAAGLLMLALPGGAYVYQGEELGLPEVLDLPDAARQDPIWVRSGGTEHGRDGCRVPLPWRVGAPAFGFGPGPGSTWLPQPEWFGRYAIEDQWARPGSTLNLHAEVLRLRRRLAADLADAPLEWLDAAERPDVLAYRRGPLTVVVIFGPEPFTPPADWGRVQLVSDAYGADGALPGESAAWLT
jgi:alpha-glucosidase